ncbi:MAG: hypothetical protein ABR559_00510 [Gemmatimonadota bacterium]
MRHSIRAGARSAGVGLLALVVLAADCGEDNPFRGFPLEVTSGSSEVWQLGLSGLPSAFDIPTGVQLFIGPIDVRSGIGTFVLDERTDGTLGLWAYSTAVSGLSQVRTGIRDLGAVSFTALETVPESGYSAPDDSLGVPVVAGHTYALRIARPAGSILQTNYAKLEVTAVGSGFIQFRWAYQAQPLNTTVLAEAD